MRERRARGSAGARPGRHGTIPPAARSLIGLATAAALAILASAAGADRNILAPTGSIAAPDSVRLRYLWKASDGGSGMGWLTFGSPVPDLPLELEIGRDDVGPKRGTTLGLQYLVTTEAFSDVAPVLSVGIRDVLDQGAEGVAGYVALTKAMGLSRRQERVVREWRLHAGCGTGPLGGVFVGASARFAAGFTARAEFLGGRVNGGLSVPLARPVSLQLYSLGGDVFVGASVTLAR